MDALKQARRTAGIGLPGAGAAHVLRNELEAAAEAQRHEPVVGKMELPEAADVTVVTDGDASRPATLQYGERVPYTAEELAERKDTEFAFGRRLHVFAGTTKPGTHIRDGPGALFYAAADVFLGTWRNHVRSGPGMVLCPSGYAYEGLFRDDRPHGKGTERYPSGDVYCGEFAAGRPHGVGVLYYAASGSRYEGSFEHGERHGHGVVFYANGDVFQGQWEGGQREGYGLSTSAHNGRTYSCTWRRDEAGFRSVFVPPASVPAVEPIGVPLQEVLSPLGGSLPTLPTMPPELPELHPAVFQRTKRAFDLADAECAGEIDLAALRDLWAQHEVAVEQQQHQHHRSLLVAERLPPINDALLGHLQRASRNGVTVDLADVLGGVYPHVAPGDVKRWLVTDLTPEAVLRLRGMLAGVTAKAGDTFGAMADAAGKVTFAALQQNRGAVGGARVSEAMFTRARALSSAERHYAASATGAGAAEACAAALEEEEEEIAADGGRRAMTFAELLVQLYPNLWPGYVARLDVTALPRRVLQRYAAAFDEIDDAGLQFLAIERLKAAQRRLQLIVAYGQQLPRAGETAYEHRAEHGFFRHSFRWPVLDIDVTVGMAKQVDRGRTGYVSLLELLQFAFPNIPCNATKERLGAKVPAGDRCACCLCAFCNEQYAKPRPPSPYADGTASW